MLLGYGGCYWDNGGCYLKIIGIAVQNQGVMGNEGVVLQDANGKLRNWTTNFNI